MSDGKTLGALALALLLVPAAARAQQPQSQPQPSAPSSAHGPAPQTPELLREELARLRSEFDALRQDYQSRMQALEARLTALEAPAGAPAAPAAPQPPALEPPAQAEPPAVPEPPTAQVPAGAAGAGGPEGALPLYGPATASKVFNPDIAVIGNFIGAAGTNEVDPRPALSMNEAEFSFQAIVDPYARADFFVSAGPEEFELEEGFVTLTSLPAGLLAKLGKMKAQFGKQNTLHPHQMPWIDEPLILTNLLGSDEGLNDSGLSVSKLILNPWFFLEATGEVFKGDSATFRSYSRGDLTWLGRLRGYRDLSESTNLDLGTSVAVGRNELDEESRTRLFGVDATLRYRPLRRAIYRRLLARSELVWSRASTPVEDGEDDVRSAFGMYVGGEYQFARRWFAGARYDFAERAFDPSLSDRSASLLLTYWPSEFGQVRGQFRRTRYAEGHVANEVLFQFLFSIGAHGAHIF